MSIVFAYTSSYAPQLPYEALKNAILGEHYALSLVFIGKKRATFLNKTYRKASYVPNVLSFPLNATTGEIYITPILANTECKKFNLTPDGYIGFLFIHALLHLKGYTHNDIMEKAEKRYMKKFKLS